MGFVDSLFMSGIARSIRHGLVCPLVFGPVLCTASIVTIELAPEVIVDQPAVRLGQIARISGTELKAVRQLVHLPLGRLESLNAPRVLDVSRLERWIRSSTGMAADRIAWVGPMQTTVSLKSVTIRAHELEAVAKAALSEWLQARTDRHEIQPMPGLADRTTTAGDFRLVARLQAIDTPARRMRVWVDVVRKSEVTESFPVSFDVKAYRTGLVARSPLSAGRIDSSRIASSEVDMTAHVEEPLARMDVSTPEGADLLSKRTVRKDDVLLKGVVSVAPRIVRGDWVEVISRRGGVSIHGRAQVLQDGAVGDSVRIQVQGAVGSLVARVLESGQVEVIR